MSIDVVLSRSDGTYRAGETVRGAVVVRSEGTMSHQGIRLTVEGSVALQLSARSVGLFEAFYSSLKPVNLLGYNIEVAAAGKLPHGETQLPFEFQLPDSAKQRLYDTYHGVYVNILYLIKAEMERSVLNKNLKKTREFVVETPAPAEEKTQKQRKPLKFKVSPESLQNVRKGAQHKIPDFLFEGALGSTVCSLREPFTGHVTVRRCSLGIRSIELQLVRVETCDYLEGSSREATEIENLQIADGGIVEDLEIPLHLVFPRLFTCPSVSTKAFSVSFEVNLIVLLESQHLITENFPIVLTP